MNDILRKSSLDHVDIRIPFAPCYDHRAFSKLPLTITKTIIVAFVVKLIGRDKVQPNVWNMLYIFKK